MARPKAPGSRGTLTAAGRTVNMEQVSGNRAALSASASVYRNGAKRQETDRSELSKAWQREAYRQINICGEARYAATLFSAMAGRAEIGVSEPQTIGRKATWVKSGPEVDAFAELVPNVRARSKLIRDFMLHHVIAGECYLIARPAQPDDPGYIEPASDEELSAVDIFDPGFDPDSAPDANPEQPDIWEIVAVTELQKTGNVWKVRYNDGKYIELTDGEQPIIRLWNPDPENRREAWSPFRSMLPTLKEIEWLTGHIFAQIKSRLVSAGVWFIPNNITFPEPPPEAVNGGADAIAKMNEAEKFMVSLAASAMGELDADEVAFPTVVMADAEALANVDQSKLIQFWSEIDSKAMNGRSDAVRRFALGMDLPPEQVLGSSGIAVSGSSGSAGSVNHWGVWANEEQTISAHIEPALDIFVSTLTTAFLQPACPGTEKVLAYDTSTLRLRQDRSKESIELFDRGLLKGEIAVRENGFDPEMDMMNDAEYKRWVLGKMLSATFTPEQMAVAAKLLVGIDLPAGEDGSDAAGGEHGSVKPRNLDDHTQQGPPQEQHDHSDAPFSAVMAAGEVLVLRALEKAGARVLNEGKRGKDRDRTTPAHLAHLTASLTYTPEFDFSLASTVFAALPASKQEKITQKLRDYCTSLYATGTAHSREALLDAMEGL